jgi:hypothetical protein
MDRKRFLNLLYPKAYFSLGFTRLRPTPTKDVLNAFSFREINQTDHVELQGLLMGDSKKLPQGLNQRNYRN